MRGDGCIIYLASMGARPFHPSLYLPAPFSGESTIVIRNNGTCRAHLSARDLGELAALDGARPLDARPLDARALEGRVSNVVRAALERFLAGDIADAEALVQAEPDEAVFKQLPYRPARGRATYIIGIVSSLVLFAIFLFAPPP